MSITTVRIINRNGWTEITMLDSVIELVHCLSGHTRLVPAQDGLFALILWYVAKSIFRS